MDTSLRQIVNKGTRGPDKILDVVLTNLDVYLEEPIIVPPINVDDPSKGGVPSDHSGVVVETRTDTSKPATKRKIYRTVRPITTSSVNNIGQVLVQEEWQFLNPALPPTELVHLFEYYTSEILETFCPSKVICSRPNDSPWISEEMKMLKRRIMREYEKGGKTDKYKQMKINYDEKLHSEAQKYRTRQQNEIISGNRSSCYAAMCKLGERAGEAASNTFTLPCHAELNYSAQESAELIAKHKPGIPANQSIKLSTKNQG